MIKQTKLWWEITAWEKYLSHNIIPRGLRIQLAPAEHLVSDHFVKQWNELLTSCSIGLMRLIKVTEEGLLEQTNSEVANNLKLIQSFKEDISFKKRESELQTNIDKLAAELKTRKWRKFSRDKTDFSTGKIYKAETRMTNTNMDFNRFSPEPYTSESELSDSSQGNLTDNRLGKKFKHTKPPLAKTAHPLLPPVVSQSNFLEPRQGEGMGRVRLRDRQRWGYRYNR
ncbi:hypothetical protein XELAEV_18004523mg [Xenopus laevis]|uniref:Uncharacterized protein n=1 Tax=Xenopus laevis TaxID=8355 RepID=A0A974GYY0_XENLA|nr:hypothetical protein XELAEV_18004523mg [Xenopus laevis]